jgi:hypothetical protein
MSENFLKGEQLRSLVESLNDRKSERLNFPDKTYALGGAGKKLALEMLERDWFLTELLLDDGSGNDFHIIDTQTETKQEDKERKSDIEDQISAIEDKLKDIGITDIASINIKMVHLTDEVLCTNIPDFIEDKTVNDILDHSYDQQADTWWVDRETLTDSNGDMNNLSKGAIRRRALSKAFFYKAQSESNTFANDHLNLMEDDTQVALIAGLGGGTGSGMFIDLARYIADSQSNARITMFGILPASTEGENERANAHAALSELEHIALSEGPETGTDETERLDVNPFSDIILSSIDATEHQSNVDKNPKLENFDSAFPYIPISYYNNDGIDDLFSRNPEYAPFTIAVPQVFQYNVKEIKQNRDKISDILDVKSDAQNAEERLYSQIETFYNKNYGEVLNEAETPGGFDIARLDKEDRDRLEDRIDLVKEFATDEMIAGSNVVDYLDNIFDLDSSDDRSLKQDLKDMDFAIDDGGYGDYSSSQQSVKTNPYHDDEPDKGLSELEKEIISKINGEMQRILELKKALLKKKVLDNETRDQFTVDLISFLVDVNANQNDSKKLKERLDEKEETLGEKKEEKESKKDSLEEELERTKEEQKERIDNLTKTWERNVDAPLVRFDELDSLSISDEIETLERTMQGFSNEIRDASEGQISNVGKEVQNALDDLDSSLKSVELKEFEKNRREIQTAIENVKEARRRWLDIKNKGLADYVPIIGDDGAMAEYDAIASTINSNRVFSVPGDPETQESFQVNFVYEPSFIDAINTEKSNIKSHLKEKLEEVHRDLDSGPLDAEIIDNYENAITDATGLEREDRMKEIVRTSIKNKISGIQSLNEDIEECENELQRLKEQKETLEKAQELFYGSADDVMTYRKGQREFRKELRESSQQSDTTSDENYEFTKVDSPDYQDTFQDNCLSETKLLKNPDEFGKIEEFFDSAIKNRLTNPMFNGLELKTLATQDKSKSFDDTILNISISGDGVLSNADLRTTLFDDQIGTLQREFRISAGSDDLGYWSVNNGGPWDVAMCMFVQGISFMDNLDPVISPKRGYLPTYTQDKSNKFRIHRHSYGLERGFFVNRTECFPVNNHRDMFVNSSEDELVEEIMSKHETVEVSEYIDGGPRNEVENPYESSEEE